MEEKIDIGLPKPIGREELVDLTRVLQDYKAGKSVTEKRIVDSESWWKLRNTRQEQGYVSRSGWLHNVIVSKHADAMDSYPEPVILPRERNDRAEAKMLSSILPCILEQNRFEQVYSDAQWQKLKTGTGVYKVVWDSEKLNGLGDIAIERVNLLNLYWEPGVTDIQKSRYLFHTELMDRQLLRQQYPELTDADKSQTFLSARFLYDDTVRTDDKVTVIECYYRKNGKLHYVKYAGVQVLYATENDPLLWDRGLYDHGMYPYVFDALFPVEGSPCGYGFVDLCRGPQTEIDLLKTAFVKNAMVGATPRYFRRQDGGVNEQEFLDLSRPLVTVNGNLGADSLRRIDFNPLDGIYVSVLDRTIQELRETSGNTETSSGNISSGVTAASAIAALQEASGKGSRDANLSAYRAFSQVVYLTIELIRQFYDLPRSFRITGELGQVDFVAYTNAGLRLQSQGDAFGLDLGMRKPEFDIRVSAQKRSAYTKVSQNELALQFFRLGFFNPALSEQALTALDMMDFEGKDQILQTVAQNGALFRQMQAMGLPGMPGAPKGKAPMLSRQEPGHVTRARAKAAGASQPGGEEVKA